MRDQMLNQYFLLHLDGDLLRHLQRLERLQESLRLTEQWRCRLDLRPFDFLCLRDFLIQPLFLRHLHPLAFLDLPLHTFLSKLRHLFLRRWERFFRDDRDD